MRCENARASAKRIRSSCFGSCNVGGIPITRRIGARSVRDLTRSLSRQSRGWKAPAIERTQLLLRERLLLINQMPSMSAEGQVAAGARFQAIAQDIAAMYAGATGREGPPPADAASWA
jgi:hypothetical protein